MSELEVGEELDKLVAEKVMGASLPQVWSDPSVGPSHGDPGGYRVGVIPYSTSIAKAWEVIERLESVYDLNWVLSNEGLSNEGSGYKVILLHHDFYYDGIFGRGRTVSLAICRAAAEWARQEKSRRDPHPERLTDR